MPLCRLSESTSFDRGLKQWMSIPHTGFRPHGVALTVVLGENNDALGLSLAVTRKNFDLHFGIRVDTDIKDLAVPGEPGVGPTAVITDANRRDAVNDAQG